MVPDMGQPKKDHVKYSRRIPAEFVESMDIHLKQLRDGAWRNAAMVVAMGDLDGKNVKVVRLKEGESLSSVFSPKPGVIGSPKEAVKAASLAADRVGRAPLLKRGGGLL